jgi:hypothetical protein
MQVHRRGLYISSALRIMECTLRSWLRVPSPIIIDAINTSVGRNAKRVVHNFDGVCTLSRCYTYLACGGGTYLLLCRPPGSVTAFFCTSCDTYIALLRIGAKWQNGRMAEWRNGGMAE